MRGCATPRTFRRSLRSAISVLGDRKLPLARKQDPRHHVGDDAAAGDERKGNGDDSQAVWDRCPTSRPTPPQTPPSKRLR